ncbi:hypothetical protein AAE478_009062 [Parahypoxylon ruwenzoriense]
MANLNGFHYEAGILSALQALLDANIHTDVSRLRLLEIYHELEAQQQQETPENSGKARSCIANGGGI